MLAIGLVWGAFVPAASADEHFGPAGPAPSAPKTALSAPDGPPAPPPPGDVAAPPPSYDPSAPPPPPPPVAGGASGLYVTEPVVPYSGECCPQLAEYMMPLYDPASRLQIPWTGQWTPREMPWSFFVGESLTYDTNIFASEHDVEDDWISNTTVGASYRRAGADFWALVSAALTYSAFFDHTDESNFNFWSQLDVGYQGCAFYAAASNRLAYLDNPIVVRDETFTTVNQNRDSYWQDTLSLRAGYDRNCWLAEIAYILDAFWADEGITDEFDHLDHTITGRFDYKVSEKTSLGVYGLARWYDYQNSGSDDFNVYSVGVTFGWRPSSKLGFTGRLGVGWSDSDASSDTDTTWVGSITAYWEATANLSIEAGWSRQYEASLGADDQIVDLFTVRWQALIGGCFTFNGSAGLQLGDVQGSSLNTADDYSLWFLNLMLHRQMGDHWALDFGYQFHTQDTDDDGIDFDQHRFTIGATYTF